MLPEGATASPLGVALVKPTTSYFWFLVTFRHHRICGLAVAFKNYFLGCLPALLKLIPKMVDISELRPNANNVLVANRSCVDGPFRAFLMLYSKSAFTTPQLDFLRQNR